MKKTAVIVFNMGGPDNLDAVKPFLFNLFSDRAIISLPNPLRWLIAKIISSKREKQAKHIYELMGGGSPIVNLTREQAEELESELNKRGDGEYKVFVAMRYWHPFADEEIKEVKNFVPDKMILLPLYPQFSTTTSASSIKDWIRAAKNAGMKKVPYKSICCYPTNEDFINAHAEKILPSYRLAQKKGNPRILFSAHGLPEKVIDMGDPYQWQVEQTAKKVAGKLSELVFLNKKEESLFPGAKKTRAENLDWRVCYQSKVGPLKWIGPATDEEILRAAKENVPLVIVPIAFVSEHSETLVELDIEYKELAENNGLKNYFRVPALGSDWLFIKALADICIDAETRKDGSCTSHEGNRICPINFGRCMNNAHIE